ncbi:MAG: ABC transporter permease, partial [Vicinamibacteria bacterium]
FTLSGGGEPERIAGSSVTAGFFETLGVRAALGRTFREEDDLPGAPSTAIITHSLWQNRFAGRADVPGTTVHVNAEPYEILGVLPDDYSHPEPLPDREPLLYTLYRFERGECRSCRFIRAVGRLREGRTIEEARAELAVVAERLEETYPDSNTGRGVYLSPLQDAIVGKSRSGLLVLYGAVGAVLLIACANLANLQLAQGASRRRTFAIQTALGAGRGRLVRQVLIESWILAAIGGTLGFFLASSARAYLAASAIPRASEVELDAAAFGFTFFLSSASAVLFGLAPALGLSSVSPGSVLVESGSRGASSRSGTRRLLVGFEVALSLLLLVAAGLLGRSLLELRSVAPGFRTESVLTLSLSLPMARYPEGDQIPFYQELHQRIGSIPGVSAIGATNILPLTDNYSSDSFRIDERPTPTGRRPSAEARSVSSGYFAAMGIALLRGRLFDERDREGSPGVVVISEAMAEKFWPGEDPLGERITYNRAIPDELAEEVGGPGGREIVGIVGNVKHLGLDEADVPMFYTPDSHHPSFHTMTLVVRSTGSMDAVVGAISREVSSMDPEVPLYSVRRLDDVLDGAVTEERFRAYVVGVFAFAAFALAVLGVYGLMRLAVTQRRREIGIRIALGARARDVVRMLVGESMIPVLWGLAAGGASAILLARFLKSLLFRVDAGDPWVFGAVAIALAGSALAAALIATLSAARLDPALTLREEET